MSNPVTGRKYDEDKPRVDLIPMYSVLEVGKVMGFGAVKYDEYNWMHGIKVSRLIAASIRHIVAFMLGQNKDQDSGLHPLAHAIASLMMAYDVLTIYGPEFDDRPKRPKIEESNHE